MSVHESDPPGWPEPAIPSILTISRRTVSAVCESLSQSICLGFSWVAAEECDIRS